MGVGRFEPNARVFVPAVQSLGTVLGLCDERADSDYCSVPFYHVRIDEPLAGGPVGAIDFLHVLETAMFPVPPERIIAKVDDVVKFSTDGSNTLIGRVVAVLQKETYKEYHIVATDRKLYALEENQGSAFVVPRETEGTEKLPL